jgi:CHAT domain-containing protein/tetratricopeptide (TPR) repeat protein
MNRLFYTFAFFLLFTFGYNTHSKGQSIDSTLAVFYSQKAKEYSNKLIVDSAFYYYEKAEVIYSSNEKWEEYSNSILNAFTLIEEKELYAKGLQRFEQAEKQLSNNLDSDHVHWARLYNNAALMYFYLKKFEEVVPLLEQALQVASIKEKEYREDEVRIYMTLGAVYTEPYRYSATNTLEVDVAKGIAYYEKAVEISYSIDDKDNDVTALCWRNIAICYRLLSKNELALEKVAKSIDIYNKEEISNLKLGSAYNTKGKILGDMANYSDALINYQKALKLRQKFLPEGHTDISQTMNNIGASYQMLGKYDDAENYYLQAIEIYEKKAQDPNAKVNPIFIIFYKNYNLGSLYNSMGKYKEAKVLLQGGIDYLSIGERKEKYVKILARFYKTMADVNFELGDFEQAKQYHEEGLQLRLEYLGEENMETPVSYQDLAAVLFEMKDYEGAKQNYEKAIDIFKKVYPGGSPYLAVAYFGLGKVYATYKQYDTADEYYEKALKMAIEISGDDNQYNAEILTAKGHIAVEQNDIEKAISFYQQALYFNKKVRGQINAKTFDSYFNLGRGHQLKKDYLKALETYETAIQLASNNDASFFQKDNIVRLDIKEQLLQLTNAKSATLVLLYDKNNKVDHLIESLKYDLFSMQLIEVILREHFSSSYKIALRNKYQVVYNRAIEALSALKKVDKKFDETYAFKALEIIERSKSAFLRQQLAIIEANKMIGDNKLVEAINNLQQKITRDIDNIAETELELTKEKTEYQEIRLSSFQKSLLENQRKLEQIYVELEQTDKRYYDRKYNEKVADIIDIQSKVIEEDMAFFQYKVTDNFIFLQVITTSNIQSYSFPIEEDLKDFILNKYRYNLANQEAVQNGNNFGLHLKYANKLYNLIMKEAIGDLDKSITRLKISPDSYLWSVNFSSLVMNAGDLKGKVRPSEVSFLIKKYALTRAYSVTVLMMQMNEDKINNPIVKTFAPKYINEYLLPDGRKIQKLPFEEPKAIQLLLNLKSTNCYFGESVTEASFREKTKDLDVLYLSAHGFIDTSDASQSGLLFADAKGLKGDGILTISEIYNLNIDARLTYLSACETAFSNEQISGEDLISISLSFAYNGCNTMVAGMWEIDVEQSKILTEYFFKELLINNQPADIAIQKAQLKYFDTQKGILLLPHYWAVYTIIGDHVHFNNN